VSATGGASSVMDGDPCTGAQSLRHAHHSHHRLSFAASDPTKDSLPARELQRGAEGNEASAQRRQDGSFPLTLTTLKRLFARRV
jgi:hypothetical protein